MPTEIYVDGASAGNPGLPVSAFLSNMKEKQNLSLFQSECIQTRKRNFLH